MYVLEYEYIQCIWQAEGRLATNLVLQYCNIAETSVFGTLYCNTPSIAQSTHVLQSCNNVRAPHLYHERTCARMGVCSESSFFVGVSFVERVASALLTASVEAVSIAPLRGKHNWASALRKQQRAPAAVVANSAASSVERACSCCD